MRKLKEIFEVDVPEGILFYPCCGRDTTEPLYLFIDQIKEFHFADYREFALPEINKNLDRSNRSQFVKTNDTNLFNDYQLVQSTTNNLNQDSKVFKDQVLQAKELSENIMSNPIEPLIYKETWQKDNNKLSITWHKYDAVMALINIDKIAVFFYRGDSIGGGGSGQYWLGDKLFNKVLDNLVDGGIIITDGSNPDEMWRTRDWRELYMHSNEGQHSDHVVIEPNDFTYRNRRFTCLGSIGQKYGIVYVWKVFKI